MNPNADPETAEASAHRVTWFHIERPVNTVYVRPADDAEAPLPTAGDD